MQQLTKSLIQAAELEAHLTGTNVSEDLKRQLTMWGAGIFRLVVMGEIKKGKSSFINAILGEEDLVPVSSDVATSTIYKIHYGKEKGYKIHFTKESGKEPLSVVADDLALFGTENDNPGNMKQVKFIEVIHPSPILKSGLTIIDTPGLGGLFKGHKRITYEYVPRADAVFFVTDSVESPIGALELEYINAVQNITPHLYFVQTKCSAVDEEARLARKRNNLNILSEFLHCPAESIPYFLLDSKARFRAERKKDVEKLHKSGFPQLMAFIAQTLQGNQRWILADRALKITAPTIRNIREIINSRLAVLQAKTEEEKRNLSEQIRIAQEQLRVWQEQEQPRIFTSLQNGLQKIRLHALDSCNQCRPGGEIQMEFERSIHACADIDKLQGILREIEEKLPEYSSKVAYQTSSQIQEEAVALLNKLSPHDSDNHQLTCVNAASGGNTPNTEALGRLTGELNNGSTFDDLRTIFYGGSAGAGMAMIVGGVIGSVIPVVGTIIGSTVGAAIAGWFGGSKALEIKKKHELKTAKQQACTAIGQAMSSFHNKLQMGVENMIIDINNRITLAIQDSVKQRKNEMVNQIETLRSGNRNESEALEAKKMELNKNNTMLNSILKVIQPFEAQLKKMH